MPSKKKKYNARFPAGRIKKIMQTDEEVGKVAQAVPVIISRTLELFVESLLTKSLDVTNKRNAKTLSPSHVKHCILSESRFDFLKDLVTNIPDISNLDERETTVNLNADNSPTINRYFDSSRLVSNPGPSTITKRPRQVHKRDNGQSSDSGSDHEPLNKRVARNTCGNGKNQAKAVPNFEEELKIFKQRKKSTPQTPDAVKPPSFAIPNTVNVATTSGESSSSGSSSNCNNSVNKQRLPNFYNETLPTDASEEEEKGNKPAYSSVIQPNPDYYPNKSRNSFGFYKPVSTSQDNIEIISPFQFPKAVNPSSGSDVIPKLHIDLTNGFPIQASLTVNPVTSSQTLPSGCRLDFTAVSVPSNLTGDKPKYGKKAPLPLLQTIKRSTSLPEPSCSSGDRIPKVNSGCSGKSRIERSSLSFDSPSSSSGTRKTEPPLLLPINLIHKSSVPKAPMLEIDEDYDT